MSWCNNRYPHSSVGKESACLSSIPGLGRSSGEGNGNLLQYSLLENLENPMNRGSWQATVHGITRVRRDLVTKPPPIIPTGKNKARQWDRIWCWVVLWEDTWRNRRSKTKVLMREHMRQRELWMQRLQDRNLLGSKKEGEHLEACLAGIRRNKVVGGTE